MATGDNDKLPRDTFHDQDVKRQLNQLSGKCETLLADIHGERGISSQHQEHEVRLTALRSKVENQEKHQTEV